MTEVETQLKTALIAAIQSKKIKQLDFKKTLLKLVEDSIQKDFKNIEKETKHLENLDSETLVEYFNSLKIPNPTPSIIASLSYVINVFSSKDAPVLYEFINKAINEFILKTQNQAFPSQNVSGGASPQTGVWGRPFFQTPQFGQQFPQPPNFGFQPPFNFQNPQGPFPGFQGNQTPGQQSSGWSSNFDHKKFLIEKLESIYKNLADQDVGDEILSEFNHAITTFKNTKF